MSDEPNMQFHREKNYRETYPVSPGLQEALDNTRTEKDVREARLSMWDVIKLATKQSTNKETQK